MEHGHSTDNVMNMVQVGVAVGVATLACGVPSLSNFMSTEGEGGGRR